MIENLLLNKNLFDYGIIIGCGLILGCSVYYLIKNNYTPTPTKNMEPLTYEEIETIMNENIETISNENVEDFITDSDFETDIASDYISEYDSASTADLDEIMNDPDLYFIPHFESKFKDVEFIMPDVDFNVCPIEELKLYEFCSLYGKEMAEHSVTEEEMMEIISIFSEKDLATN
jgi:hypothetical protein